MTIKDSFRFLTKNGGEHIITLEADTYIELLSMIAEAEADVLTAGGTFLLSVNLRPSSELANGAPAAPVADAAPAPRNGNGNGSKPEPTYHDPVEEELPFDHHIFHVKEVFHDTNQSGDKDFLKVVLQEQYEYGNGKYGIAFFKADDLFPGWKAWKKGQRFAPPKGKERVIIQDPPPSGKFANIVNFLPAKN